jgi:hypothetical protein
MRLEQQQHDNITGESYYDIINSICLALKVTINTSVHHGNRYHLIFINNPVKLIEIIKYLDTYPLFSSKFLNYNDLKICHSMILDNRHLTLEARSYINTLMIGMNSNRTYYN